MHSNFVTRFVLTALMSLSACFSLHAQADVANVSTIAFSLADDITVHQTQSCVPVAVTLSDPTGVASSTLLGAHAVASVNYPRGTKTAYTRLCFYASYYPTGDYPFKATVTNANGVQTTHSIMVHLVP